MFVFVSIEEDTDEPPEEIDPLSDDFSPDDNLPPLRRILSYYRSENNDNRYMWLSPSEFIEYLSPLLQILLFNNL